MIRRKNPSTTVSHLSIDVGGTKIRVVRYSQNFKPLKEAIFKTADYFKKNGQKDLEILFSDIREGFGRNQNILGISFNCVIKDNKIIYSSLLGGYTSINLKSLAEKFFIFKSFISDNDVFCMAKAELKFGVGKKYNNFLLINLGTGIRFSVVSQGNIVRGINNLAGEISLQDVWVSEIGEFITVNNLVSGRGFSNLSRKILNKNITAEEAFMTNEIKLINLFINYLLEIVITATYYHNPYAVIFAGSLTRSRKMWFKEFKKKYYKKTFKIFWPRVVRISSLSNPASIGAIIK